MLSIGTLTVEQSGNLTTALGTLPDQPRARRTWEQAATRIEAYRFDHKVTDPGDAPRITPERPA